MRRTRAAARSRGSKPRIKLEQNGDRKATGITSTKFYFGLFLYIYLFNFFFVFRIVVFKLHLGCVITD